MYKKTQSVTFAFELLRSMLHHELILIVVHPHIVARITQELQTKKNVINKPIDFMSVATQIGTLLNSIEFIRNGL